MPRAVKAKAGATTAAAGAAPAPKKAKKNKLYAMPEKITEGTVLTDLAKGQWKIGPSIGTGGFGEIYSACRVGEKNYEYVVKCEPHGNGPLFVEMHFYMRNARLEDIQRFQLEHGLKSLGMPYMIGNGSADIKGQKHRFIVMPRYGSDVARHLTNGQRLPEGTAYRLALQMIDVYEFVHTSGYVHADLKAANILLGYGKNGGAQAYLVDYGLASHYTTKDFKPDPKKMHNGTIEYTSRDAHLGVPTMRADLEILGYNLIEWLGIQLPWIRDNLLATPAKVQKAKEEFMDDVSGNLKLLFTKGVPVPIAEFMKYVAKMQYNETPDYVKCRKMFSTALKTMKYPTSGDLDFKSKSATKDNNNETRSVPTATTGKAKARGQIKTKPQFDSSVDMTWASDDDDDDVILDETKPTKATKPKTHRTLKTIAKPHTTHTKKVSPPARKITPKLSPTKRKAFVKISPTRRATPQITPTRRATPKISPTRRTTPQSISPSPRRGIHQVSPSPRKGTTIKTSPKAATAHHKKHTSTRSSPSQKKPKATGSDMSQTTRQHQHSSSSSLRATRSTPLSAKANINFSPSISMSSSRPGKTIINDSITPNARAGKIYEFNFELDVSMDANVIVNVKRKKKVMAAATSSTTATSSASRSHRAAATSGSDDTPVTRVKVRKLAGDDDAASPITPAVTVKKSRRQ